ncbi:MAG TPA: 23S rRNA (guanosine(2251)-2'-O)-methyltransferase RlmB [Pyrinomonadaceae bacterium]|nr:23S rRNA (guanosine(2251)-2'-O)-methyltransferase RlmB [Pyrinomonadaceae bacterium]
MRYGAKGKGPRRSGGPASKTHLEKKERSGSPERHEIPPGGKRVVYGHLPVLETLRANPRRLEKIIVLDSIRGTRFDEVYSLARENGILTERVPKERLESVTGAAVNHQGIAALTAAAEYAPVEEIFRTTGRELIVVLDSIEDPRNFGAILRTAECAGVDGVIIPERRAVGLTDTVAKSAAGATEHIKVAKVTNLNRLIEDLKKRNIWVVGATDDARIEYTSWDWTQPTALILGSEGSGLHRLVAENCDELVNIPMYGRINSLNVSVAAGVILFEARRQRELKKV